MASGHPYKEHREMHVAHRRVKHIMRSGGHVQPKGHPDVKEDRALISRMLKEHEDKEMEVEGKLRHTRLDKRARGGAVGKFADGGPIRKITPSKHKPHVSVNVVNIHRGSRPPPGGLAMRPPGLPGPAALPAGGPPVAPPPIRPPIAPMGGGMPMRPPGMKHGGKVGGIKPLPKMHSKAVPERVFAKGGAVMRHGKKYGEKSGEGRLEEFKHLGGNPRRG